MSSNESKGPIQVFGNSAVEINDALRQIQEQLDAIQGLRGRSLVFDRVRASDPTVDQDVVTRASLKEGANIILTKSSGTVTVAATGLSTTGLPFVTIGNDATLTAERALTGTSNQITVTDDGANSTVTLSTPQNIHTGASPTFAGLTLSSTPLAVGSGGTGAASLTDGGPLLGSGTGAVTALGQPTNGQLIIGSTGADPVLATVIGTANEITVTNGAGTITLSLPDDVTIGDALTVTGNLVVSGDGPHTINLGGDTGDDFAIDTSKFVVEGDTGHVGIGIAAPLHALHVVDNTANEGIILERTSATAGKYGLVTDTSGNVGLAEIGIAFRWRLMKTSGVLKFGANASAIRATTEGTDRIDIFNGTAPVGTLSNGISLYSTSGELRVMDAAGNPTLLSPHDKKTNEWIFLSMNARTKRWLKVDMERFFKWANNKFADEIAPFVHEWDEKEYANLAH